MKPGLIALCLFIIFSFTTKAQPGTKVDSIKIVGDSTTSNKIFERVEIEAAFPGGEMAWRKFLEKNLNPNVPVNHGAPAGKYTVFIQFVVDKQGNIKDVTALTEYGFGMEEEVMRIIKLGPKWVPAVQRGRNVNAYRKQPVTFMLQDENFEISSKESYVFYTGIENPITINTDKVKPDNLRVTISEGSIDSKGDGKYIVKVNKPGRVVIEIFNTKKANKKIGAASFEVKRK